MSITPSIAVAVPAYSRPDYLKQLAATIPSSVRVFVSDNAGSMQMQNLALGDHVTISHADSLLPMFSNWNRALSLVDDRHTHVLVPSDDDLYLPHAFERIANAIRAHGDVDIFIFGCDLVDEFGNVRKGYVPAKSEVLEAGRGFGHFRWGVEARMPGVVFRKAFLDRIGAFDESFQLTAADSELIQRALLLGKAVFVPEVVGLYRVWAGSLTHSHQATDEWMREIHAWTNKIALLIQSIKGAAPPGLDLANCKDEIVARNMLAGARGLLSRGEHGRARAFLRGRAIPRSANFKTKIRLARCHVAAWTRGWL